MNCWIPIWDGTSRTSSDSFEFPHPSIKILDDLSGISSWIISARSEYDLNQSNESSTDSLIGCEFSEYFTSSRSHWEYLWSLSKWLDLECEGDGSNRVNIPVALRSILLVLVGKNIHDGGGERERLLKILLLLNYLRLPKQIRLAFTLVPLVEILLCHKLQSYPIILYVNFISSNFPVTQQWKLAGEKEQV